MHIFLSKFVWIYEINLKARTSIKDLKVPGGEEYLWLELLSVASPIHTK